MTAQPLSLTTRLPSSMPRQLARLQQMGRQQLKVRQQQLKVRQQQLKVRQQRSRQPSPSS